MATQIDRVVPAGSTGHDNNVWIVGDGAECVIIDASHDVSDIVDRVADRLVHAILITHAHHDHIGVAPDLAVATNAPVLLHAADRELWTDTHPEAKPQGDLHDGQLIRIGDVGLRAVHTPGHTPGSCVFHCPDLGVVFTGDTLFPGGPGATRWEYSSFDTIIESVSGLFAELPTDTVVHPGHGESTTIGAEAPDLPEWKARGW